MQILTQEETAATPVAIMNRGEMGDVHTQLVLLLANLELGESVLVKQEEYSRKQGPSNFLSYYFKKRPGKFVVRKLLDKTGWMITCKEKAV